MIAYGLVVTAVAWVALHSVGELAARALFGRRAALVTAATRLPLGLATSVVLLEFAGYFLPIRVAAWLLVPLAVAGAFVLARRGRALVRDGALVLGSFAAMVVGLAPVRAAGRFTAAALTNNDGTYYITTADWLARVPWRAEYPSWDAVPTSECMTERVLHLWQWRIGTPNLMAAVSSLSGLGSTASLAVVTVLLFGCVPCAAIGVARGLGVRGGARELVVAAVPTFSAATAFLGYQHMTGHLGVASLFPAACGASLACARHGGWRRTLYAGLLFAASVAFFADGAAVLLALGLVALAASRHHLVRAVKRLMALALATLAVGPFTLLRAARAAWNTVAYRVPSQRVVFPQRGWLPRNPFDDLASLTSVDPWPPWPAAWPPNTQTVVEWTGALCGALLLVVGATKLRRRHGELASAVLLGLVVVAGAALTRVHYLEGKVLLTGALFVAPLSGIGAAALLGRAAGLVAVPLVVAELAALAALARPSAFKVVDGAAHDALVGELAKLPRGSLLALDGLGAPADDVLDEHRAERAALLAGLEPMQPGLDGGFYTPVCYGFQRPDRLPERAFALQRTTSETLTHGATLAEWAQFRIVETRLAGDGFIAAWAPTHGFIAAEHDRDGRVFRWAEWTSQGTLRAVAAASCARLEGELRVVDGSGAVAIQVDGTAAYLGNVFAEWTPFRTAEFSLFDPVTVNFAITRVSAAPPDAAHALAMSRLALVPSEHCGAIRRDDAGVFGDAVTLPVELDERGVSLVVKPPLGAACYQLALDVDTAAAASVRMTLDGGAPSFHYVVPRTTTLESDVLPSANESRVSLAKSGAPDAVVRLTDVRAVPRRCKP